MIVAARANGLEAIDGPYSNFGDQDGYRTEAGWASSLGCSGKWAIHPSQIEIANDVFSPTEKEVSQAQAVIEAVREAEAAGAGAASLGGFMIDAATARVFQVTLDRQAQIDSKTA
jgi:citrate lyase beta subunit